MARRRYRPGELIDSWGAERFADAQIAELRAHGIKAHKVMRLRTQEQIETLAGLGLRAPTVWEVRAGARPRPIMGEGRFHVEVPARRRPLKVRVREHLRHPPRSCACYRSKTVDRVRRDLIRRLE